MAAQAKYLFDDDFGAGARAAAEKPLAPAELAIKLGEAESQGFADGFAAAEKENATVAARRTAIAFEQIGDALDKLARGLAAVETRLETEAVELASAIARKLAPELVAREPLGEISALAAECFKHLATAPHVVVRVNDALHPIADAQLAEIARARGFEGRLMVLAEPEIALGDCQIEWADGGVVRNAARTERTIATAITRYLGARQTAAMPDLGDIQLEMTPIFDGHASKETAR
jgi:flagellar assembly protein FliH